MTNQNASQSNICQPDIECGAQNQPKCVFNVNVFTDLMRIPDQTTRTLRQCWDNPTHHLHELVNNLNKRVHFQRFTESTEIYEIAKDCWLAIDDELGSLCDGKFSGLTNIGDGLFDTQELAVMMNWATIEEADNDDPTGWRSKMSRNQCCLRWYQWVLPKWMYLDSGGVWTDEVKRFCMDRVGIVDFYPIIPVEKDDIKDDVKALADVIGKDVVEAIAVLKLVTMAQYHQLRTGKPLKILVASANARDRLFANKEPDRVTGDWADWLGSSLHGESFGRKGLKKLTAAQLDRISTNVFMAYQPVLREWLDNQGIALDLKIEFIKKWGNGGMTEDQKAYLDKCFEEVRLKGAEWTRKAWAAFKANNANVRQLKFCEVTLKNMAAASEEISDIRKRVKSGNANEEEIAVVANQQKSNKERTNTSKNKVRDTLNDLLREGRLKLEEGTIYCKPKNSNKFNKVGGPITVPDELKNGKAEATKSTTTHFFTSVYNIFYPQFPTEQYGSKEYARVRKDFKSWFDAQEEDQRSTADAQEKGFDASE